jgi:hypothetical protein
MITSKNYILQLYRRPINILGCIFKPIFLSILKIFHHILHQLINKMTAALIMLQDWECTPQKHILNSAGKMQAAKYD